MSRGTVCVAVRRCPAPHRVLAPWHRCLLQANAPDQTPRWPFGQRPCTFGFAGFAWAHVWSGFAYNAPASCHCLWDRKAGYRARDRGTRADGELMIVWRPARHGGGVVQVWPGTLRQVTDSAPSAGLSSRALPASTAIPSIRWLRTLPRAQRSAARRGGDGRRPPPPDARRYGAVVAAHALSHLAQHAARAQVVRQLWERVAVGGLLVLAEPGSPVGSAFVRQAREQVIREECRREVRPLKPRVSSS